MVLLGKLQQKQYEPAEERNDQTTESIEKAICCFIKIRFIHIQKAQSS